ncbi:Peptidoglycan-binding (PGRP) domain of peptidoglycan hydrolases-containing protein [Pedococcus dokdonensis]|uniref:Peptidoglycan-binding (PGRP) domain of peptidoglycan hydrolases-containing protein n=1 Tax=Pedococcus dokdonensis TaxID=443156 RepID=A0A1H0RGP5_9MICO|nr:peptidoglycan-binding protein [Pedococcus dokdonensis]SDP28359.1 Peptidoglycan-binding (PGRP) domain of peptidoglycan hydrolases-containing protein [Pedococcus dokdonensis]
MSRAVRAFGVLAIPVLTVPVGMATADAATLPKPPTKTLPSGLDVASPYQAQRLCDPNAKPGVVAFAKLMSSHYKVGSADWGITRNCNSGLTEHSEGRAWDWMLSANKPNEKAIADSVTQWLSAPDAQGRPGAMARRFGIMYIIWNHKMWRAYDPARGWAPYTGAVPHTDHIHFSFSWDGAYSRTSWWTGKPLTTVSPGPASAPKPTTPPQTPSAVYSLLIQGATGPDVVLAQKVIGVTPDGIFGPKTAAALRTWQGSHGVKVTGQLDPATWAKMVALKLIPPRSTSTPAKPTTPPPTTTKPPTTPAKPPVTTPTKPPVTAPVSPLAAYAKLTLKRGSSGSAVVALQKALGITADGAFGPKTEAAVKAFQARHNLPATGIVGASTWAALMSGTGTSTGASRGTTRVATPYTALMSTVLRNGSRGAGVKTLQRALGGLSVDGAFGPRTASAVKAFQKSHHLAQTGVVDSKVWQALENRDYPLRAYYGTVLKPGSRGAAVTALQKALRVKADGVFGSATVTAVKALQGRAKLARTGVVATLTWQALEAELRRR